MYTNSVHGFLGMLLSLIAAERPTHLAVAFDLHKSFRNDEYPEYKGTRSAPPEEFVGQVERLQRVLSAMNVHWLTAEGYEADDILATLSHAGAAAGFKVLVVSGDRDSLQLINDNTTVLYPIKGVSTLTRYTDDAVHEKYGVHAAQYPEIAALVGETSDNLPGVPGVGPKTAAKWINKYGSLDEIYAHQDEIKGKAGESLRAHLEDVKRNRDLNRLRTDVPLETPLDSFKITHIDRDMVDAVFDELKLRTMKVRVKALGEGFVTSKAEADSSVVPANDESQTESANPFVVTDAVPDIEVLSTRDACAWLEATKTPVGVTLEWADNGLATIGLATTERAVAVTDDAFTSDNRLIAWLESAAPKILFDAKPALKRAWSNGFTIGGLTGDALLSWYLHDPARSKYQFDTAAELYFMASLPQSDPTQLLDERANARIATMAWMTLKMDGLFSDTSVRKVLEDIELPVLSVLAQMEYTGIAVDYALLDELYDSFVDRARGFASEATKFIGHEVNLASPKQLQTVLFDELGMPKTRKTKTGYSTDAESLTTLYERTGSEFLALLTQYRDWTKLGQIVETLRKSVASDGRIHTTYLQTGAATGRLSSTDPNLQNIPVRSTAGAQIRGVFTASAGRELMTADYSQIEMRIMAHLSEDPGLITAFKSGEDLHRYVGAQVFGVTPAEVTPEMRAKVKAMSYGLVYGLSAFGLAKQLRIPQPEAKTLMTGYFERFGGVRDYLREVVERAREVGYTETIFGRRRYFPDLHSHNRMARDNAQRAALNAPIQGSAADIMKIAMLKIDREFSTAKLESKMLLQVHDEVILDVVPGELDQVKALVIDAMDNAVTLKVPLDIHVGTGLTWATAAHD